MNLSRHFTFAEMTVSEAATRHRLDNTPGPEEMAALKDLCIHILDPLREALGAPVIITSGYRSPDVNRKVKGSKTSQHVMGQAADLIVPGKSVHQVCTKIVQLKLPFDQLIYEFGSWTHVSYGPRNRRQVLTAGYNMQGKVAYTPGLPR